MHQFHRILLTILWLMAVCYSKNSLAETSSTTLDVACQVVKHYCPVKVEQGVRNQSCPKVMGDTILLDEVKFICPDGGAVKTVVHYEQKNQAGKDQTFYRNANCTEVWDPNSSYMSYAKSKDTVESHRIFCKRPSKLEVNGKQMIEVTFTLLY